MLDALVGVGLPVGGLPHTVRGSRVHILCIYPWVSSLSNFPLCAVIETLEEKRRGSPQFIPWYLAPVSWRGVSRDTVILRLGPRASQGIRIRPLPPSNVHCNTV